MRKGRRAAALAPFGFGRVGEHGGLLEGFLGLLEGLGGMLHGTARLFVSGEVVLLAVMRGRGAMGVRRAFVHFRGSDVRISSHDGPPYPPITVAIR
jgi:hypothetical protein